MGRGRLSNAYSQSRMGPPESIFGGSQSILSGSVVDFEVDDDQDFDDTKQVDVQQLVQIMEIYTRSGIPLDSRLYLLAVKRNWPHLILVLSEAKLKLDMDVRSKDGGLTAVMLAAREGKKACLAALLTSGRPDVHLRDDGDRTALMHAAYSGEADCVKKLLMAKASLDVESMDGTTLLMGSCYGGLPEFAKYLLQNGADVNAENTNGYTALLFAAQEGHMECVEVCLEWNASIYATSKSGITMLMAACAGLCVLCCVLCVVGCVLFLCVCGDWICGILRFECLKFVCLKVVCVCMSVT